MKVSPDDSPRFAIEKVPRVKVPVALPKSYVAEVRLVEEVISTSVPEFVNAQMGI